MRLTNDELDNRLRLLFEDEFGNESRGSKTTSIRQKENESVVLDYLEDWFKVIRGEDRKFLPLVDPNDRFHCPPVDAFDDHWEYVVEVKQSTNGHTPSELDRNSGGIWFTYGKCESLRRLCGMSRKLHFPHFSCGYLIYSFDDGSIFGLTIKQLDDLLIKQDAFQTGDLRWSDRVTTKRTSHPLKSELTYAVPSKYWKYFGNYLNNEYYEVKMSDELLLVG